MLKGYPRLSETFIAQEILNLQKAGFEITIFSLRHPTDKKTHPVHHEITSPVVYLPEYLHQQPLRILRAWLACRKHPGYNAARTHFLNDLKRDRSANRIRRFGQALVLAYELPTNIRHLYAHFLHTPASVTRYCARILDLPWACSAHAKDIYTSPNWEIREKLADCQWLTTCTRQNVEHLQAICDAPDKVSLNYHGLDLERFNNESTIQFDRDGSDQKQPVILLSVGRAVEKKGYQGLLLALSKLDQNLHWKLIHIGGGGLLEKLKAVATELGIDQHIEWLGAQSQQTVLEHYRNADLFVLNCKIDQHGDRDGLPNVMVEAQSQALPVISTTISGIPELIENNYNGLLVEPDSPQQLTSALSNLIKNPGLRMEYGKNGQQKVNTAFEMHSAFSLLLQRFNEL